MLDTLHLPRQTGSDVQIFARPCTVTNLQWETWRKPRGAGMIQIFCVGGGAGGGGGFTAAAAAARGGGGGGGASGVTRLLVAADLIPDILYIQVGAGGRGVSSGGGTAGSGIESFVSVSPHNDTSNLLVRSAAAVPTGGGTGTGAAAGAAGVGGTVAVITSMERSGLGIFLAIAGGVGFIGGAPTGAVGGPAAIPGAGEVCQGGSGGAGTTSADFAGGLFTAIANSYLSEQRPATPAAGSNNGSGGVQVWKPFFSFGGGGGSSSNTGIGGLGGNGAYGSGGGGGGGGTTGGRGGDGGSGIVIITSW